MYSISTSQASFLVGIGEKRKAPYQSETLFCAHATKGILRTHAVIFYGLYKTFLGLYHGC